MRFSFEILPEQPVEELLDAIELADRLGFHGCYGADETYHKDMWLIFAAAAARTERIVLAPGVTHVILAGTPEEWVDRLRADFVPSGIGHIIVVPADPFIVESWSGRRVAGLPDLAGQLRLLHEHVLPALA